MRLPFLWRKVRTPKAESVYGPLIPPSSDPAALTVAELVARYWAFAEGYYRPGEGRRTSELDNVKMALRPLVHLYERSPAAKFGPCGDRLGEAGDWGVWPRCEVQDLNVPIFSPARDREERFADLRASRKSKVPPAQVNRKKAKPGRTPTGCYSASNLNNAVARACRKAGVSPWHVNQLRHWFATQARRTHGLASVQVALGDSQARTSERYAEPDVERAVILVREIG